jgi:hypothetical protein
MENEGYKATIPQGEEGKKTFRGDPSWKKLYFRHINYLKGVYRGLTADGKEYTDDMLDKEATEMADTQYMMIQKQVALENRMEGGRAVSGEEEKISEFTKN